MVCLCQCICTHSTTGGCLFVGWGGPAAAVSPGGPLSRRLQLFPKITGSITPFWVKQKVDFIVTRVKIMIRFRDEPNSNKRLNFCQKSVKTLNFLTKL